MKKMERELAFLRQKVTDMGNLTEKMVLLATEGLADSQKSSEPFQRVLEHENRLDLMQLEIDKEAVRLLTIYSPVAADLRTVMSVSRIAAELERIGDQTVNLCESVQLMQAKTELKLLPGIHKMASVVKGMIGDTLNAFVQSDIRKAQATIAGDNIVDVLNDQVLEELLSLERVRQALSGPQDIAGALSQLLIARSLERIADLCTNISEEVVYLVKGRDIRHRTSYTEEAEET